MKRRMALAFLGAALAAPWVARAQTGALPFDASWQALTFPRLAATRYAPEGARLGIAADQSSSLIYRALDPSLHGARQARWSWAVSESVPATDLSRKGGDDRNIALYFIFMDAASARRLRPGTSPQRLLSNRSARVVMHVWGGSHAPGSILPSPYLRGRGFTIVQRPAGTGEGSVATDLGRDHARAFGQAPEALVGVAVSADSDDTATRLRASISNLTLG